MITINEGPLQFSCVIRYIFVNIVFRYDRKFVEIKGMRSVAIIALAICVISAIRFQSGHFSGLFQAIIRIAWNFGFMRFGPEETKKSVGCLNLPKSRSKLPTGIDIFLSETHRSTVLCRSENVRKRPEVGPIMVSGYYLDRRTFQNICHVENVLTIVMIYMWFQATKVCGVCQECGVHISIK